jgi:hypothetical protein
MRSSLCDDLVDRRRYRRAAMHDQVGSYVAVIGNKLPSYSLAVAHASLICI